jgi:hypothetical protein
MVGELSFQFGSLDNSPEQNLSAKDSYVKNKEALLCKMNIWSLFDSSFLNYTLINTQTNHVSISSFIWKTNIYGIKIQVKYVNTGL